MEMNYCRRCGAPLTKKATSTYTCQAGHTLYVNAAPCVGVFFITSDKYILLSVRGVEPFKGALDAIGGFVDEFETFEEAAAREVREETGLHPEDYGPLNYISTEKSVYPYDGEERNVLGVYYYAYMEDSIKITAADDVAEIAKVDLKNIDFDALDNVDIREAILKLQKIIL